MGKEHILLWALVAMTAIAIHLAIVLCKATRRRKRLANILCRIHASLNAVTVILDSGLKELEDCDAKLFFKVARFGAHTAQDIMKYQLSKIINYRPYMRDVAKELLGDL